MTDYIYVNPKHAAEFERTVRASQETHGNTWPNEAYGELIEFLDWGAVEDDLMDLLAYNTHRVVGVMNDAERAGECMFGIVANLLDRDIIQVPPCAQARDDYLAELANTMWTDREEQP